MQQALQLHKWLTGGSWTNIEALRHSMNSLLSSVSIFVSWNKNSATGWGGAFIWRTIGSLFLRSWSDETFLVLLAPMSSFLSLFEVLPVRELLALTIVAPDDGFFRPVSAFNDELTEFSVEMMWFDESRPSIPAEERMKPVVSDAFNEGSVGNWFDMFQLKWQSTQNMWRRQLLQIKQYIFFRWGREELLRNVEMMGNGLIWRLCGSPIVSMATMM